MRDITDFSARDSKRFNRSAALYEDALKEADGCLRNFRDSMYYEGVVTEIKKKTHNSKDFLNESKNKSRKMNMNTNAVEELIKAKGRNLKETLMLGSTKEDLEDELENGTLGLDILQVFLNHNITGAMVWQALDVLKDMVGAEPDVEDLINNWSVEGEETEEDVSDDEGDEEVEDTEEDTGEDEEMEESVQFPKSMNEMTRQLRRHIAEKRLRDRARRRRF